MATAADLQAAFEYTFPFHEMARTRYLAVDLPLNPNRAGVNALGHRRTLATHSSRAVTTPNNDTLYSSAWLDLRHGPIEFSVPAIAKRYWSLHFMDATSNTAELIGNRNAGEGPTRLWILQEGDAAAAAMPVPAGARVVRLPTRDVWMLARILVDDATDAAEVHKIQAGMQLRVVPKPATAVAALPADPGDIPHPDVPFGSPTDGANYLAIVNRMLARNPLPATQPFLPDWEKLGVRPGGSPTAQQVADWTAALPALLASVQGGVRKLSGGGARTVQGWFYPPASVGIYGNDYKTRADVALGGLGALPAVEAIYLSAMTDHQGQPLRAGTRYRVRIGTEGVQAQSFWSISMYQLEADGRLFFVQNPIGRFAMGDRTQGTTKNADGSWDIVVQAQEPTDPKERANWLPAPKDLPMQMILRAYLPSEALRTGKAPLPVIEALP